METDNNTNKSIFSCTKNDERFKDYFDEDGEFKNDKHYDWFDDQKDVSGLLEP